LATVGGTPYFAPIRSAGGAFALLAILRWRRPEARLVFALACVPQTPLLYETVPLFLVPYSITEGGVLWLGSWLAALWLSMAGPFATDFQRFSVSVDAIGWCMYFPAVVMLLRRPNVGPTPERLEQLLRQISHRFSSLAPIAATSTNVKAYWRRSRATTGLSIDTPRRHAFADDVEPAPIVRYAGRLIYRAAPELESAAVTRSPCAE
jgi:hypothetical protein